MCVVSNQISTNRERSFALRLFLQRNYLLTQVCYCLSAMYVRKMGNKNNAHRNAKKSKTGQWNHCKSYEYVCRTCGRWRIRMHVNFNLFFHQFSNNEKNLIINEKNRAEPSQNPSVHINKQKCRRTTSMFNVKRIEKRIEKFQFSKFSTRRDCTSSKSIWKAMWMNLLSCNQKICNLI